MNNTDTTTAEPDDARPLPPLPRLIASLPFTLVAAITTHVVVKLCGCDSVEQVKRSIPLWRSQIDAKRSARRTPAGNTRDARRERNEAVIRASLALRDATGKEIGPLPFHTLTRNDFASLRPVTRKVLRHAAARQAEQYPDEPVPAWLTDATTGRTE